jgi:hypothetical protein
MRKTIVVACALALSGIAATSAFADCQTELKAAEDTAAKITDVKQKAEVQKHITAAKSELAAMNEKACLEHVAEANAAAKTKPGMKP